MTARTPVVLYVGDPIAFAHEDWVRFQQRFNIITHEYTNPEEIISALKPGGKYDSIQAIVRPSNPTAERDVGPFTKELIAHLPPSLKIISSVNHGYENEDTEELGRKGILYCNGAGGGKSLFFFLFSWSKEILSNDSQPTTRRQTLRRTCLLQLFGTRVSLRECCEELHLRGTTTARIPPQATMGSFCRSLSRRTITS